MQGVLLLSAVMLCAQPSGKVDDQFFVNVPPKPLIDWVASNTEKITEAAGSKILQRTGTRFWVYRHTPRGAIQAMLEESVSQTTCGYEYGCKLVPGTSSAMTAYSLKCTLVAARLPDGRSGSLITISVSSTLNLRVRDFQIDAQMRKSIQQVRTLLQSLRF